MNNRQVWLFSAVLFLCPSPGFALPPAPAQVAQEAQGADISRVGPARIGQTEAELLALLGEPEQPTEAQFEPATALFKKQWLYPEKGIGVTLAGDEENGPFTVQAIILEEPAAWEAVNGLRIGMDVAQARGLLKALQREGVSDFGDNSEDKYGVLFEDTYTVLVVGIIEGKVKHLYLGPGPE